MRSLAKTVLVVIEVLSIAALVGSYLVQGSYERRAVKAQRVQIDHAAASLFGDGPDYELIGSPQWVVVDDPKAFVKPGLLDEGYLQSHRIYPLQLQTVRFVAANVRLGAWIALVLSIVAGALLRRRASRVSGTTPGSQ